jgi:hypothetical protein
MNEVARTLIERYGAYLCSYAVFQNHPYDLHDRNQKSFIMLDVERVLYQSIEKGLESFYGADITILLSVLVAEIGSDETIERLAREHPESESAQHQLRFHPPRQERFAQVQRWCASSDAPSPGIWEETLPLIQRLCAEWDALPVISPLVERGGVWRW